MKRSTEKIFLIKQQKSEHLDQEATMFSIIEEAKETVLDF